MPRRTTEAADYSRAGKGRQNQPLQEQALLVQFYQKYFQKNFVQYQVFCLFLLVRRKRTYLPDKCFGKAKGEVSGKGVPCWIRIPMVELVHEEGRWPGHREAVFPGPCLFALAHSPSSWQCCHPANECGCS